MIDRPTDDKQTDGRWLTYGDAAQLLGISSEALRSLARRQRWDRRSPNAVGGQAWVLIPSDRLPTNGRENGDQWSPTNIDRPQLIETNGRGITDQWSPTDGDRPRPTYRPMETDGRGDTDRRSPTDERRLEDRRLEDILTAVREMAETLMGPVREQMADLRVQLVAERERANRAKDRAREAEGRIREAETRAKEYQDQLQTEMIEHRRVVATLANQLAARRSWWHFRQLRKKFL